MLLATSPIAALVIAHFATHDERISKPKIVSVVLGFTGILVLVGIDIFAGITAAVLGQLVVMLASICYVSSTVLARHIHGVTPMCASGLLLAISALYMLPLAIWWQPPSAYPTQATTWAALLFLSLAGTGFAYLLRFQLIMNAGVTFLAQVAYLVPMFALLWGWVFLDEIPEGRTWIALALVLAGIFVGQSYAGPGSRRGIKQWSKYGNVTKLSRILPPIRVLRGNRLLSRIRNARAETH